MNDTPPEPTATRQIFGHERVAAGYASARPHLHPEVFARVRTLIRAEWPLRRGLDVGCGTGLSSVAMLDLAREVTGVDAAVPMLRRARPAAGVRYLASSAEALPFRDRTFDLVVACGSIDWVDRSRFLPRAAELLVSDGWLVSLDFGDTGRSLEIPGLERWHEDVFRQRFPRPASADPLVRPEEAARFGFEGPEDHSFATTWSFDAAAYTSFLMTESNVIAAVEYGGIAARDVGAWLESELAPIFAGGSRVVAFAGYVQLLRKR